jgi:hypothetical protein
MQVALLIVREISPPELRSKHNKSNTQQAV